MIKLKNGLSVRCFKTSPTGFRMDMSYDQSIMISQYIAYMKDTGLLNQLYDSADCEYNDEMYIEIIFPMIERDSIYNKCEELNDDDEVPVYAFVEYVIDDKDSMYQPLRINISKVDFYKLYPQDQLLCLNKMVLNIEEGEVIYDIYKNPNGVRLMNKIIQSCMEYDRYHELKESYRYGRRISINMTPEYKYDEFIMGDSNFKVMLNTDIEFKNEDGKIIGGVVKVPITKSNLINLSRAMDIDSDNNYDVTADRFELTVSCDHETKMPWCDETQRTLSELMMELVSPARSFTDELIIESLTTNTNNHVEFIVSQPISLDSFYDGYNYDDLCVSYIRVKIDNGEKTTITMRSKLRKSTLLQLFDKASEYEPHRSITVKLQESYKEQEVTIDFDSHVGKMIKGKVIEEILSTAEPSGQDIIDMLNQCINRAFNNNTVRTLIIDATSIRTSLIENYDITEYPVKYVFIYDSDDSERVRLTGYLTISRTEYIAMLGAKLSDGIEYENFYDGRYKITILSNDNTHELHIDYEKSQQLLSELVFKSIYEGTELDKYTSYNIITASVDRPIEFLITSNRDKEIKIRIRDFELNILSNPSAFNLSENALAMIRSYDREIVDKINEIYIKLFDTGNSINITNSCKYTVATLLSSNQSSEKLLRHFESLNSDEYVDISFYSMKSWDKLLGSSQDIVYNVLIRFEFSNSNVVHVEPFDISIEGMNCIYRQ